jgi:hypothetical protein
MKLISTLANSRYFSLKPSLRAAGNVTSHAGVLSRAPVIILYEELIAQNESTPENIESLVYLKLVVVWRRKVCFLQIVKELYRQSYDAS